MSFLLEGNSDLSGKTMDELFYIEKYLINVIMQIESDINDFNNKVCFLKELLHSKENNLEMILKEIKYRKYILAKNKPNCEDNNVYDFDGF